MISSAILFYGPGAQQEVIEFASSQGRLLAPPFGEKGLKTDEASQIVDLLTSTPVGDLIGVVVVGPMDNANPKSSDVLLKSIEEFNGNLVFPVLWAWDLGGVAPTIRSRCMARWSYGEESYEEFEEISRGLTHAWKEKDIPTLIHLTKSIDHEKVLGVVSSIAERIMEEPFSRLWFSLRRAMTIRDVSPPEILVAFLKSLDLP